MTIQLQVGKTGIIGVSIKGFVNFVVVVVVAVVNVLYVPNELKSE
jgi:hypothetical protein